ncbi:MAG: hypothetical protein GQ563_03350, partial [Desulfuromusa sp.]|nr:hypothetical protein [Desulfuromusa sp.]
MKRLIIAKIILLTLVTVGFSANVWGKTVTLSWDASPSEVSGYKIYYDAGSSTAPLDGTGATEGVSPIDVGNVLTFTVNGLPDGEDHYFAVAAYDASDNESTYSNIVNSPVVINDNNPPVLAPIGNKSILEGATLNFTISATDADADTLAYSVGGMPVGAGFNIDSGVFSWVPALNQSGSYSVTFAVSDGSASDSETIIITVAEVNQLPVLNSIGIQTIDEGSQLTFTINGSDPDNDALSYSAANLPVGAIFDSVVRSFSWIPDYDESENTRVYPVTFTVSDGVAGDSEIVTINVTHVNRAPVLEPIGTKTITEGDIYNLVINATDPDNNLLTYSATNLPSGSVFIPSTRSFSWIPGNDQAGTYQTVFAASDRSLSDSETVTFIVSNGNEAPVLDAIGDQSISEDSQLLFV